MRAPQAGRQFNCRRGRHDAPVIIVIRLAFMLLNPTERNYNNLEEEYRRGTRGYAVVVIVEMINVDTTLKWIIQRIGWCWHSGITGIAIIEKATEEISSAEWYALVSTNLGLLAGLIQIYQNRKDYPFESRPATMAISLTALCISIFTAAAMLKSKSKAMKVEEEEQQTTGHFFYCRRIRDMLVLISGVLILSCVVSVFVPDGLGWIVFVSCASTISALVVGAFLFLTIFGRTKSSHGESGPNMV